jgi:hypothetical protein
VSKAHPALRLAHAEDVRAMARRMEGMGYAVRWAEDTNHRPGWGHVLDSAIQVGAALLGMHMLWRLQRVSVGARDRSTEV